MRIATWNVNSVRQRMDSLQSWLAERKPDIVCLQEIKCVDEAMPLRTLFGLPKSLLKTRSMLSWKRS